MADHPYRHLGDRAFWSRAVAANFNPALVPEAASLRLDRSDRFMSAGSCFAANVRRYLDAWGLRYVATEGPHPQWPEAAESAYYEAYSARYGNVYSARQMAQLLQRALGDFSPEEDHWVDADGRFIDPYRPGLKHRACSLPELRELTSRHLRAVKRAVEDATVFLFTLGLTEAWVSAADGAVFPACPGTVAGEYDPNRHRFVNFTCSEVVADLDLMIMLLRRINSAIRVIVTVSPVPLVATASGRHVLTATAYSKSVLRVAADEIANRHVGVAYFPAYEMVLGPQHRESPFADDLRTVREPVIAEVMEGFRTAYIDASHEPAAAGSRIEPHDVSDAVEAAINDECEEMFADEALSGQGGSVGDRSARTAPDLDSLRLGVGAHIGPTGELCLMEAVALYSGEAFGDHPPTVPSVLGELLRSLNDAMADGDRQRLKPVIPMLAGSKGEAASEAALSWMVMDWHCRTWASTWLRDAGCETEADALISLDEIIDARSLRDSLPALARARDAAASARAAAARESLQAELRAAVSATGADPTQPAILRALATVEREPAGPAMRAAQKLVPVEGRWGAKRSALWREASDAAAYAAAVAAGAAQVAAVRAMAATSAWSAAWDVARTFDPEAWERAREDARSIGRDAAIVIAWRSAWTAAIKAEPRTSWHEAAEAARQATRLPVTGLQAALIEYVRALLDRRIDAQVREAAHVAG